MRPSGQVRTGRLSLSVVIPIHRSERYIGECLDAVLAQEHPVEQVVLVDDLGGDRSIDIAVDILTAAGVDHTVVRQDRNRGAGCARNAGVSATTGQVIWFFDSDDLADPAFTRVMVDALTEHGADVAACRTALVGPDGRARGILEDAAPRGAVTGPGFVEFLVTGTVKALPGGHVFRREVLGSAPWDERRAYEDMVATARMALRADRVAMVDAPLYRYRQRADSVSRTVNGHTLGLFEMGEEMSEVIGSIADGQRRRGLRLRRRFSYREVLIPAAHMAMRARHDGADEQVIDGLLVGARERSSLRDVVPLLVDRQFRSAVFAAGIVVTPKLYSRILRRRPDRVHLG
ncbi:glycosyltransferase family 2 protein [Gordonia sp. OPL2]|nr:glycosyltransferase family 2 protein [Gordonia sp. OPL2]